MRSAPACLTLAVLVALASPARADVRLFRPLTADPRENQTHWRMSHYTEDWRYGTDVTDSTSQGGWVRDRQGFAWEVGGGETFRWIPLERIGHWRGPWKRYQVGLPAGLVSRFDGTGILLNTDYQYGASFDALWRGAFDSATGVTSYHTAVLTSRLTVMHHSSHLGDEYIAQGAFGRNQVDPPFQGPQLGHPPVKRMDLSYEDAALTVSLERSAPDGTATLRLYAGGTAKLTLPKGWRAHGLEPANMRSPTAHVGAELRTGSESGDAPVPAPVRAIARVLRMRDLGGEWLGAVHLRLAKPYNFASADNPAGETEAWTPRLWTASPYGREFRRYAGSWHAMAGFTLRKQPPPAHNTAPAAGPELVIALDWYRGYSPDGQLQDQRLRYRPRAWLMPSVTAHF